MGETSSSDGERWMSRLPDRRLARWVGFYLDFQRIAPVPETRTVAALNSVVVVFDLDTPVRYPVAGSPLAAVSPVVGLSSKPLTYTRVGRERGIIVELTPLGARALFGLPLREISCTRVGIDDLLGARARVLREELQEARDSNHRFRILDRRLASWLLDAPELPEPVDRSWRSLTISGGAVKVDDLAKRAGLSRQHLATRFHREVGLPPKVVGRIARCHHAVRLLTGTDPPPLPRLAALCGYTDQAHLNRDFRLLIGRTPTALQRPGSATDLHLGSLFSLRPTPLTGTNLEAGRPLL
ncbi:helix-turn-helix domain-containing protein [Amycolatopsis regifaucium]|uniref:AraC family transcriptional regulator n=1 Tax=Amycolatopsis regifaucium TaxID=546365 RepID=A0A154MVJ5_9PSEU|nr:helix-turn-helix domain-containing protein [Amycolatopsis regifaucium]KZB88374.1 AraC family transcriptional regulator [Amycolatopsis regifaucium]OKA11485.1 AraC family transcriptional regulator [Amycolatopsis regifaucium]SFH40502.1 Helix-turn-helix domain-containing protein [Amycolatopsis regifaucium]